MANRNDGVIHKQIGKFKKCSISCFGNTHGNQIYDQIIALTQEKNIDIIILAEYELDFDHLIDLLNGNGPQQYKLSQYKRSNGTTNIYPQISGGFL